MRFPPKCASKMGLSAFNLPAKCAWKPGSWVTFTLQSWRSQVCNALQLDCTPNLQTLGWPWGFYKWQPPSCLELWATASFPLLLFIQLFQEQLVPRPRAQKSPPAALLGEGTIISTLLQIHPKWTPGHIGGWETLVHGSTPRWLCEQYEDT